MGNSIPHHHEDHIAGKGENSLQHHNLFHKFIPMPQALKIPAAKAAVDNEWENLEKISAWNLTKVRIKKEVIDEARTKGAKVHFASLMDVGLLKLDAKHRKYKRRVVFRSFFFLRKARVKQYPSQTTLLKTTSPHDHSELTQASLPSLAEARLVRQA